jgi:hypothetical protein
MPSFEIKKEQVPEYKYCPMCHCQLFIDDFFRFNTKGRVKRYYKVCNKCILKNRIRQRKNKDPLEDDKREMDNICNELIDKISKTTYISDGKQK